MLKTLVNFYSKYRTIIVVSILIFAGLQIANVLIRNQLKVVPTTSLSQSFKVSPSIIKSVPDPSETGEDQPEAEVPSSWLMWFPVIFISVAASIIYLFQNWKGVDRFFPGYILMRAGIVGNRRSGILKWQISVSNRKNETITFSEPILVFSSFTSKKKFKINSNDFSKSFPITLGPKTNHTLIIELNQFYQRYTELTQFRFVRTEISASNGKTYKSIYKVLAVKMRS